MSSLQIICNECGCKRRRLLENECKLLKQATNEYKQLKLNNDQIKKHLNKKLYSIIKKYKLNKPIIHSVDCKQIENGIVHCYVAISNL